MKKAELVSIALTTPSPKLMRRHCSLVLLFVDLMSQLSIISPQDFWEYDALSEIRSSLTDFGGGMVYNGAGFSIGVIGYVGLGFDRSGNTK